MAHTFVLQDWLLIESSGTIGTITQSESGWLDLSDYQDVVFFLLVNQASTGANVPSLSYQTSPEKLDTIFQNMVSAVSLVAAVTPIVTPVLMLSASVPLARYVRWQLTGTNPWSASFRVIASANAPGL